MGGRSCGEREREEGGGGGGLGWGEGIKFTIIFFKKSVSLTFHPASPKRFGWGLSSQLRHFSHDFKFWFQRDVAALSASRMICQFTRFSLIDIFTA